MPALPYPEEKKLTGLTSPTPLEAAQEGFDGDVATVLFLLGIDSCPKERLDRKPAGLRHRGGFPVKTLWQRFRTPIRPAWDYNSQFEEKHVLLMKDFVILERASTYGLIERAFPIVERAYLAMRRYLELKKGIIARAEALGESQREVALRVLKKKKAKAEKKEIENASA